MSPGMTRRTLLRLAAAPTLLAAMSGALRAEGGAPPLALPFAHTTPIRCGEAVLRVRDLDTMVAFYRRILGLKVMERSKTHAGLGAGGVRFLRMVADPDAAPAARGQAGLFHTAFLMPGPEDLARWLVHAARLEVPLTGFADHRVSEAVYLDDPEGNGIEVYRDRPPSEWLWMAGEVVMGTAPLDLDTLLGRIDIDRVDYRDAPDATRIGHVHLQVGDLAQARAFYHGLVGLDVTAFSGMGALFMASGGYHHHLGLNVWNSRGAGARAPGQAGLDGFSLLVADPAALDALAARLEQGGLTPERLADGGIAVADPWGIRLDLRPAPA